MRNVWSQPPDGVRSNDPFSVCSVEHMDLHCIHATSKKMQCETWQPDQVPGSKVNSDEGIFFPHQDSAPQLDRWVLFWKHSWFPDEMMTLDPLTPVLNHQKGWNWKLGLQLLAVWSSRELQGQAVCSEKECEKSMEGTECYLISVLKLLKHLICCRLWRVITLLFVNLIYLSHRLPY